MMIMKSYRFGLETAVRTPKLSLLLWLFNFAFAGTVAFVFAGVFSQAFDGSLTLDALQQNVDLNILLEFFATQSGPLGTVLRTLLIVAGFFFLAQAFFSGGILNVLLHGRGGRTGEIFFAGGGRFFWRFLRLLLYSIPLWIVLSIVYLLLSPIFGLWEGDPNKEMLRFILILVRIGLILILVNFGRMILDYARIRIVRADSAAVARSLIAALRFISVRPGQTLGLYYFWGLTGLLIFAGYVGLQSTFPKSAPTAAVLGFLITQVHILIRSGLRIALQAGQAALFDQASAESVQGPGRQGDDRLEKVENGVDRDSDESEGEKEQPDQGEENEGHQGQRPADHQQDEPE